LLIHKHVNEEENQPTFTFEEHSLLLYDTNKSQSVFFPDLDVENNFVMANTNDQAYIQYIMSKSFAEELTSGLLSKIPKSINRIVIWRSLISMTSKLMIEPVNNLCLIVILDNIVRNHNP
jgi:hypothetical protein